MKLSPLKQKRRSAIIKATRKIFLTKGFIEATMLDISEEMGISRRTLYSYFKTKEDLSFEVIYDSFHSLYESFVEAAKTGKNAREKLVALKQTYLEYYENNFDSFIFTLYFDIKLSSKVLDNSTAVDILDEIQKINKLIVDIVKEGMDEGVIRKDLQAEQLVTSVLVMIHSFLQKMAVNETVLNELMKYDSETLLETMFEIIFSYIK